MREEGTRKFEKFSGTIRTRLCSGIRNLYSGSKICGKKDSNPRRHTPTGPKPVPFDRSGIPAYINNDKL